MRIKLVKMLLYYENMVLPKCTNSTEAQGKKKKLKGLGKVTFELILIPGSMLLY